MKNIAVIGAGTMGNGIAHTFAQNGYRVQLIDINEHALKNGIQTISNNLDRMLHKELISREKKIKTLNNITTFTSVSDGVEYASLVVEAATENENIKLKLFRELDIACPDDTILATNTSSISITKIAFISNRILMPMINEAIEALQSGVSGVLEIDSIMKLGMAHPMGPLELADFIGLDVCLSILEVMHKGFKKEKYAPNALLINMVQAGKLGKKTGEGFYNYFNNKKAKIPSDQFL